jgi:hypothetical protein
VHLAETGLLRSYSNLGYFRYKELFQYDYVKDEVSDTQPIEIFYLRKRKEADAKCSIAYYEKPEDNYLMPRYPNAKIKSKCLTHHWDRIVNPYMIHGKYPKDNEGIRRPLRGAQSPRRGQAHEQIIYHSRSRAPMVKRHRSEDRQGRESQPQT